MNFVAINGFLKEKYGQIIKFFHKMYRMWDFFNKTAKVVALSQFPEVHNKFTTLLQLLH